MRILFIADPWIPVPPKHYGGIERVVHDMASEMFRLGHQVTLFAGPNSSSPGIVRVFGRNRDHVSRIESAIHSFRLNLSIHKISKQVDVIHNFGRLAHLTAVLRKNVGKVQTYMREVHVQNIRGVMGFRPRKLIFTGVSDFIARGGARGGGIWKTIYNCAPLDKLQFRNDVDAESAPLVFLGRLERCKGAHTAITVAKLTNRRLILAGNISKLPHERKYFEEEVRPLIDGNQITYIGVVDNESKNHLLGAAAALLSPIQWEEPFPVVLPESLACGTPVLAFRGGGMAEGITHSKTGFLSDTVEEMAKHVHLLCQINRADCRLEAEIRYSVPVIADEYLKIYNELLNLT